MTHYRLRTVTLGVDLGGIRPVAISIPAESILQVPDGPVDSAGFVKVEWDGKSVQIFAVDLRDRGDLMNTMSVKGARQ